MICLFHLLCTLSTLSLVLGRTSTFLASDANISLSPRSAWSSVAATSSSTAGQYAATPATVEVAFAGQQVIILGASSGAYQVTLDDTQYQFSRAETGQLFRIDNLDPVTLHSLSILSEEDFLLQQVKIAYANFLPLTPSLVPLNAPAGSTPTQPLPTALATAPSTASGFVRTSRPASSRATSESLATFSSGASASSTSRSASVSTSSIVAPSFGPLTLRDSHQSSQGLSPGAIAGAVLGTLAAVVLLVVLVLFCIRRRNTREAEYRDADSGRQRGSRGFAASWPRPDDAGNRQATGRGLGDGAEVVHSGDGWAARLARSGASQKEERLSETRRLYNIASKPVPPIPTSHFPSPPVSMMVEASTPDARRSIVTPRGSTPPFSSLNHAPSPLSISRPTRSPPKDLRILVPPRSQNLPSTFAAGLGLSSAIRKDAPLPQPPQASPSQYHRLSAQVQRDKKAARRPSHVAQEDYYASTSASDQHHATKDARLSEVIEEPEEGAWGEEDRPHFFQTREVMPKYSGDRDPRM